MKKVKDLTEDEAKDLFYTVFPDRNEYRYKGLQLERLKSDDGKSNRLTFGGQYIENCILYRFGLNSDSGCLFFADTKVINWLHKNGFDITELLDSIIDLSDEYRKASNICADFAFIKEYERIFQERRDEGDTRYEKMIYDQKFIQEKLEEYSKE